MFIVYATALMLAAAPPITLGVIYKDQRDIKIESLKILKEEIPTTDVFKKCSKDYSNDCAELVKFFELKNKHVKNRKIKSDIIHQLEETIKETTNDFSKTAFEQQLAEEQSEYSRFSLPFLEQIANNDAEVFSPLKSFNSTTLEYKNYSDLEWINNTINNLTKKSPNRAKDADDIMTALNK